MAETVAATWQTIASVRQTLDATTGAPGAPAETRVVTHNSFDGSGIIDANSSVPATKMVAISQALTAGAATIDLTSLTGTNAASVTFSGLRLQILLLRNPSANEIRFKSGATNGHLPGGADTAFDVTIPPRITGADGKNYDGRILFFFAEAGPDVSATSKTFDLTGTGAQTLDIVMVAG